MKFIRETIAATKQLAAQADIVRFTIVGSSIYMPDPKDVDFVVLLQAGIDPLNWTPKSDGDISGWQNCGKEYDDQTHKWRAIREGCINLLVTNDRDWYEGCVRASDVCAALNLQSKADRVRVHRVVREGYTWEQAREAPMREGVVD